MSLLHYAREQARARQRGKCARCGELLRPKSGVAFQLSPEETGGREDEENFVVLCRECFRHVSDDRDFQNRTRLRFPISRMRGLHKSQEGMQQKKLRAFV